MGKGQVALFALIWIGIGLIGMTGRGTAHATSYGNPAPDFKKDEISAGIALSDDREDLFLDWGISDAGILRAIFGSVDLGADDGTEFGVGYRHKPSKRGNIGEAELRLGGLVMYRIGEADNISGLEFSQLDLGFGGATSLETGIDVYGIAIYRRIETEALGIKATKSDVGAAVGAEINLGATLRVGGEIHFALENDNFGFYAQMKF